MNIIFKTRPAYNSRTEKRIVLLFVAIEPEGKDGHFNVLFQSSNCLPKKIRVLPRSQAKSSSSSSSSSSSRIGMVLKSANYTNRFRISWKDIFKYQIYEFKNAYIIITYAIEAFPWRHVRIFRIVQTKRGEQTTC